LEGLIFSFHKNLDKKKKKTLTDNILQHKGIINYNLNSKVTHFILPYRGYENLSDVTYMNAKHRYNCKMIDESFIQQKIAEYVPPIVISGNSNSQREEFVEDPNIPKKDFLMLVEFEGIKKKMKVTAGSIDELKRIFEKEFKAGNCILEYLDSDFNDFALLENFRDLQSKCQIRIKRSDYGDGVINQWNNLRRNVLKIQDELYKLQKLEFDLSVKIFGSFEGFQPGTSIQHGKKPLELPSTHPEKSNVANIPKQQVKVSSLQFEERELKIFISSPFKDMNEERDLMMKIVIPKLKRLCTERDIVLNCVDLRWGVTEGQSEAAATLLMCLREIEKCNIFIGLYGERYGICLSSKSYTNPTKADENFKRNIDFASKEYPWIKDFQDRSLTEIEMRMILDSKYKGNKKSTWFYLRDEYYIEGVPDNEKKKL